MCHFSKRIAATMIWSIFSYAYLLFVYFLQGGFCWGHWSVFSLGFWLCYYWVLEVLYIFWIIVLFIDLYKYFIWIYGFYFHLLKSVSAGQKCLMKSRLPILWIVPLVLCLKSHSRSSRLFSYVTCWIFIILSFKLGLWSLLSAFVKGVK